MGREQKRDRKIANGDELLHGRALEMLASTVPEGDFFANAIWGRDFAAAYEREREAYFVVDIRDWEDYCLGHIDGSVHLDFNSWASPQNLSRLPRDRKIIVICDNGCASAQVSAGLRMLGYDAAIVRTGMNGWARNRNTEPTLAALENAGFPVARAEASPCVPAPEGISFGEPPIEAFNTFAQLVDESFRGTPVDGAAARNIISPARLRQALDDGAGSYFILDLREDFDFEGFGHIEGARWMDFRAAAVPGNLEQLPRDRTIVTVCYTGNMAAQLTTVLRLLGYDSLVLDLGMAGWVKNPITRTYLKDISSANNPVAGLDDVDCGRAAEG